MSGKERGQALPLLVLVVVVLAGSTLLLGRLGGASLQRASARTAADAAALAGAAAGEDAARRVAEANGARVVSFERRGQTVWVTVRFGRATARATAARGPMNTVRTPVATGPDG